MLPGLGHQDLARLPRIMWADVVSRAARSGAQRRETQAHGRTFGVPSKVHRTSRGRRGSERLAPTQLPQLQQERIPEERPLLTPPRSHHLDPQLQTRGHPTLPERGAAKTIWVDLRPLLEKVAEPSGSWPEELSEEVPWGDGRSLSRRGRSSGGDLGGKKVRDCLGGRRGGVLEDCVDGEHGGSTDGEDYVDGNHGGSMDGEDPVDGEHGGPIDGEHSLEGHDGGPMDDPNVPHGGSLPTTLGRTSTHPKAGGPLENISRPSKMGALGTHGLDPKETKTPQETRWPQLLGNSSPAAVTLPPQFGSPVFLPRIVPTLPAEAESSTGPPPRLSPDFQLPTHLLLRRLEETTTSKDHRLIAGILSALREELSLGGANAGDPGEKQKLLLELPRIKPPAIGTPEARQGAPGVPFAPPRKSHSRFPWKVC